jgi:hypothetical protein
MMKMSYLPGGKPECGGFSPCGGGGGGGGSIASVCACYVSRDSVS